MAKKLDLQKVSKDLKPGVFYFGQGMHLAKEREREMENQVEYLGYL